MAVPSFVGAGSGVAVTTAPGTVSKTSCTAGNIIVVHTLNDGTAGFVYPSTFVNLEDIAGVDNQMDHPLTGAIGSPTAQLHDFWIGRAISNGTCSFDVNLTAGGDDIFARMYEFSGASTSTSIAAVMEAATDLNAGAGTSISVSNFGTTASDCLVILLVGVNNNTTIAASTGESGGDYTEPTAEFSSATGTAASIGIQTAGMASPGTISGGSIALGTSSNYGIMALSLVGAAAGAPSTVRNLQLLGVA